MDGHLGVAVLIGEGDHRNVPTPGRILDGVVQQVEQCLLQPPLIATDDQPGLDPDPDGVAVRIGLEVIGDVFDELREVQPLEVIGELVILDPVDGGEVLHQVGETGRAAMDAVDQGAAGFLVEPVLLGQQGVRLRLDAGQRRLQFVGDHRDEVGSDLVDLLQPFNAFFFQGLPPARLVELRRSLDRGAQGAVQPDAHVPDQQARHQGDKEEKEDSADYEPWWRRNPGKPCGAADQDVQAGHHDRRGQRTRQAEPHCRGDDQQIEEQREVGWGAVAAGAVEDAGGDHEVNPGRKEAKPPPRLEAADQDYRDHQVDQAPAKEDRIHDKDRRGRVLVAEVIQDDAGRQDHPSANHRYAFGTGAYGRLAVPDDLGVIRSRQFSVRHVVITCRQGSCLFRRPMPWLLILGNRLLSLATQALFAVDNPDTQCAYRAFWARCWPSLAWRSSDYAFASEMLVQAKRHGIHWQVVPIRTIYLDRFKGTGVEEGVRIFRKLIVWRLGN